MHDEACVNYRDMITNMDLGLRWLRNTFGCVSRPHAAWHIDTFGHSRGNAEMLAKMGFDSFYFARLDAQVLVMQNKLHIGWFQTLFLKKPRFSNFKNFVF